MNPPFDVIVFGATGFTGRLVAEYLHRLYGDGGNGGPGGPVRWALAGRQHDKLQQVRNAIGASPALPLVVADATDAAALARLVGQTRVLITTVGPYQRHGQALASACAQAGIDYVDLCGEPAWMAQMIPLLDAPARASGARIVFSCGFDSVPFDLGVVFLQAEAQRRFGAPLAVVRGRVRRLRGGMSGGTMASALATMDEAAHHPATARTMADPFALTPGFVGPAQPDGEAAAYDDWAKCWTGPFMMATINTKNVHRTNALRGHPWGRDFLYDERLITGPGRAGEWAARLLAGGTRVQHAVLGFGPARALLGRVLRAQPGGGPGPAARASGHYDLRFFGRTATGQALAASVKGDSDPGYGSTSKIVSEAALCLLQDIPRSATGGGVWTPGAAMGLALLRRLQAHAGLRFAIED